MGAGGNGDVLACDVNAQAHALGVDVGEVALGGLGFFVCDVQADVIQAVNLHFVVYGACHDVARSQGEAFIILLHELFAVGQTQYAAVAAHGLGNEIGGMRLLRIVEYGGMELHELHVLYLALGTVDHGYAVAGGNVGVGRGGVYGSGSARGHQCETAQIGVNLSGLGIQYVGAVAFDVGRAASDADAQVVLCDDFHGKVVFQHFNVGIAAHGFHQSALYLGSGIVGMVEDAEFGVSAFAVQVEIAVLLLVEVHAPFDEILYALRSVLYNLFHGIGVADEVSGNHGVLDVFLKVVHAEVGNGGYSALGLGGVGLFERSLAYQSHSSLSGVGHFQGVTHARYAAADNKEVKFAYHKCVFSLLYFCISSTNVRKKSIRCINKPSLYCFFG